MPSYYGPETAEEREARGEYDVSTFYVVHFILNFTFVTLINVTLAIGLCSSFWCDSSAFSPYVTLSAISFGFGIFFCWALKAIWFKSRYGPLTQKFALGFLPYFVPDERYEGLVPVFFNRWGPMAPRYKRTKLLYTVFDCLYNAFTIVLGSGIAHLAVNAFCNC